MPVTSSIFDSSHVRADPTTIQTEQLSLGQVGQFDSAPVQVTPNVPAVTQGQTGHQSGIALTMQQHAPGYQHQHIGSYGETPGQIQAHTQYVTSESEVLPLDNPAETVPGIEKQDTGFDGSYTHYPENTGSGYDQQSSATFTSQEHQDQYQQHTEGSTMVIHETYESVQDDQEEVNAKEQATSGVDGIFGAEHNEANVQKPLEAHPAEAMSQQYAPYDQEPQHAEAVLSDEPTLEQQSVPHLPTEGDAVSSQDTWLHGHQHQGELTHGESYAVENQHQDQDGLNHGQTAYHEHIDTGYHQEQQQGAYLQSGFQQVDYQQVNSQEVDSQNVDTQQASYQQGDYQQTDQQTEYQQTEYQKTEYQQPEYQQTEYQQNEYQQSEYQKTEYQQTEYQQTEYQQVDYQQGEYQQGGYHQYGEYHEGQYQDHHHDEHQQAEYQTNDYYQHSTSTEPGVLPVSNDEDPNPTEFQSATAAGSVQDLPEGDYEEGQFISFGAVPSFPSYGGHQQSVSPPHQQQYRQETVGEDMNDLGIGNTSLRREESVPAATSTGDGHLASGQQPTNTSGQGAQQTDEGRQCFHVLFSDGFFFSCPWRTHIYCSFKSIQLVPDGGQRSASLNDVSRLLRRVLGKDPRFTMTMNSSDGSTEMLPQRTKPTHNRWLRPQWLAHSHRPILQRLVAHPRLLPPEVCRGLPKVDPQVGLQFAVVLERNMWTFLTHRKPLFMSKYTVCRSAFFFF